MNTIQIVYASPTSSAPSTIPSSVPSTIPSSAPSTIPSPSPPQFCVDSPLIFNLGGKQRKCSSFLKRKAARKCKKGLVQSHCPFSCNDHVDTDLCSVATNTRAQFYVTKLGNPTTCAWVSEKKWKRCKLKKFGVAKTCRKMCLKFL